MRIPDGEVPARDARAVPDVRGYRLVPGFHAEHGGPGSGGRDRGQTAHGVLPTPPRNIVRPGSAGDAPGRQVATLPMPGGTSSRPSKNRVTSARERRTAGAVARAYNSRTCPAASGPISSPVAWESTR